MTTIITLDRLKLYRKYCGDIEGFLRSNRSNEKEIFADNLDNYWRIITRKIQDVELISNRMAPQDHPDKTIKELKEICDKPAFEALTSKINFYSGFQTVANILQRIKQKVTPHTNTIWTGFDSAEIFLEELNQDIEDIQLCNFTTLDKINIEFAVTSTYQELAISNGWGDEYLKLAEEFDKVYERIKSDKCIEEIEKPGWKLW